MKFINLYQSHSPLVQEINNSSNFNLLVIKNISYTISKETIMNPKCNKNHLDILDDENILGKFSDLCNGKTVTLTEENLHFTYKIVRELHILNCPDF